MRYRKITHKTRKKEKAITLNEFENSNILHYLVIFVFKSVPSCNCSAFTGYSAFALSTSLT